VSGIMAARNHELRLDVPLERAYVAGDAGRLRQVFSNLLVNAAKYTEPGGRICVASTIAGPEPDRHTFFT
jgi:signal transduction histidine kinase